MNQPNPQKKPEDLLFKLGGQLITTVGELVVSIAVGTILVGKFVFDTLHQLVVEPLLKEKRKMQDEAELRQDSPHDDPG
jgi:hypothetical protein